MSTRPLDIIKRTFEQLKGPVRLVLFTQEAGCERCPDALEFAKEIKSRSPKIALETYDIVMDRDKKDFYGIHYVPAIAVEGGNGRVVRFYGVPESVSTDVLLDCIVELSTGSAWFTEEVRGALRRLEKDVGIQVFIDADCPMCPAVAKTAARLALESDKIFTDIIIAGDFPELIKKHKIATIPKTIFGGNLHKDGHVTEAEFLEFIFRTEGVQPGIGKRCLTCGQPSSDIICVTCKTRIQAEAVEHKRRSEKGRPISAG